MRSLPAQGPDWRPIGARGHPRAVSAAALTVEPARPDDVDGILDAMRMNREERSLAQQPPAYVRAHLAGFLVARDPDGRVLGAAQVREHRPGYVEILSVSIHPDAQGRGAGGALMVRALEVARSRRPRVLWLSTEKPDYFARFGFTRFSKWELPLSILATKALVVLRQRPDRWWSQLTGAPVFMRASPDA